MNKGIRFTDEFKQDAVAQVLERGYAVSAVAERLGISMKSLYAWRSQSATSPRARAETSEQAAETRRLKRELAGVTSGRDILKNSHGSQPACARYKQPVVYLVAWRAVADPIFKGQTPLKNVAQGLCVLECGDAATAAISVELR
jgi:transposase